MTAINLLQGLELSASVILDSMISVIQRPTSRGEFKQEIISSGNVKRTFTLNYFSENYGENVLICYTKPQNVMNNSFLIKKYGKEVWVLFPKTNRIRKLANHAKRIKAQGSDFTYEDFFSINNLKQDYIVRKEESGARESTSQFPDSLVETKIWLSTTTAPRR